MADQTNPAGIPASFQAFAAIVTAEAALYSRILDLLGRWAGRLRSAVFGSSRPAGGALVVAPDPVGVRSTAHWFAGQLDDVLVEVREIFDDAAEHATDAGFDDMYRVRQAVDAARNRLVRVPDSVFRQVRAETMKATTQGWSIDDLAGRVDDILAEAGAERWQNRARTIARTEVVAAYNGGTFAGFQSYAKQVGGRWDKVWLETHDHRTRPTHQETPVGAGGQRVPLDGVFVVGGYSMPYPGWPLGPAEEVINCRCSLLLVRENEDVDYGNRQFKG